MEEEKHLIECEGLTLSYDGKAVLENVNFTVRQGDYLCIIGENGSGKSTLVRALLGLKHISGGEIKFGGGLTSKSIGYLPQQTGIQRDFPASVREVVLSGCLGGNKRLFYSIKDRKKASENMEKLGIAGLSRRSYRELSGGQQQRVLLARALCAASRLLLLDEPVAGLDPLVTSEMYDLISKLNRLDNMTVIMVSHDIESALRYSNKILHLDRSVAYFGDTSKYPKRTLFGNGKGGDLNV